MSALSDAGGPAATGDIDAGWLVFDAASRLFATGDNLVGLCASTPLVVEKLEVHVVYPA